MPEGVMTKFKINELSGVDDPARVEHLSVAFAVRCDLVTVGVDFDTLDTRAASHLHPVLDAAVRERILEAAAIELICRYR